MKKLLYVFLMISGMALSIVNVNAQDPKCCGPKETKMACCKSAEKDDAGKCANKGATSGCVKKDAATTGEKIKDDKSTCKAKDVSTASEAKVANTPK
jgi:hypothetical protein